MAANQPDRLQGWKAIGRFLGVDARTARRWEAERGLPVRRLPGGDRASVWAYPGSLSAWLAASSAGSPAGAETPGDAGGSAVNAGTAARPSVEAPALAGLPGGPPAVGPGATTAGSRRVRLRHGPVALLLGRGLLAAMRGRRSRA